MRVLGLLILTSGLLACGSTSDPMDQPDSGTVGAPDAVVPPMDSGTGPEDAGHEAEDVGGEPLDLGSVDLGPRRISAEVARAKLESISVNRLQLWVVNHVRANRTLTPDGQIDESKLIADALQNAEAIVNGGADMIIMINSPCPMDVYERVLTAVRERYPTFPLGVSALDYGPDNLTEGFRLAAQFDAQMVWCEVAPGEEIEYQVSGNTYLPAAVTPVELALETQAQLKPDAMHTAGVHMKYTRNTDGKTFEQSMMDSLGTMDGINITGPTTGVLADVERVQLARQLAGDHPMGLASGVSNDNLASVAEYIDYAIVGTSLKSSQNTLYIDEAKVRSMRELMNSLGGGPR